jgi:hypothetical protein
MQCCLPSSLTAAAAPDSPDLTRCLALQLRIGFNGREGVVLHQVSFSSTTL